MELEIYNAFVKAGVSEADAKAAVESAIHSQQLATRGDLADAKVEIIKWTVGSMFTAVALFATITKLWH